MKKIVSLLCKWIIGINYKLNQREIDISMTRITEIKQAISGLEATSYKHDETVKVMNSALDRELVYLSDVLFVNPDVLRLAICDLDIFKAL